MAAFHQRLLAASALVLNPRGEWMKKFGIPQSDRTLIEVWRVNIRCLRACFENAVFRLERGRSAHQWRVPIAETGDRSRSGLFSTHALSSKGVNLAVRALLAALVCLVGLQLRAAESRPPNVVLILADDLGWSDTTLYGTTQFYRTPNIERLAGRGKTFTRAYAASPLCSPTRASILTGLSPARVGITAPTCHLPEVVLEATAQQSAPPGDKATTCRSVTRLETNYFTLARALKAAGYATGHFGKWHLGSKPYSPLQHGFDVDLPHWPGPGPAGSFVAPWRFPDFKERAPGEHIEDRMADEAVAFIEQHKARPFFLNYWQFSVHAPFDAKRSLIEKHRARVDPGDPQRSPTYAAMVESLDDAVGKLLDALDRFDLATNTIIVFLSDNGGNMYDSVDGTTPTSNAPLRGGKATMFEGGIRVPCVVAWPGFVAPGSRSDAVVQSTDFYPTLLEMIGLQPRAGQRFDGISIVPALKEKPLRREAIFTFFPHQPRVPDWLPPAVAVHQGDWKLIRLFHGGQNGAHRWKLFNLKNDLGEKNDLAERQPKRVKNMDALIEQFLKDTQAVVPLPNPKFNPAAFRPEDEGISTRNKPGASRAAKPAESNQ
jgi:arylsulfatase A-like enzyme